MMIHYLKHFRTACFREINVRLELALVFDYLFPLQSEDTEQLVLLPGANLTIQLSTNSHRY